MTVEERIAQLEARIERLEAELKVEQAKEAELKSVSMGQQLQNDFAAVPEVEAEVMLEAASYTVSAEEIKKDMKEAGIEIPEAAPKAEKEAGETADQQLQSDYAAVPELSAIEQLEMESYSGAPAAVKDAIKAVEEEN